MELWQRRAHGTGWGLRCACWVPQPRPADAPTTTLSRCARRQPVLYRHRRHQHRIKHLRGRTAIRRSWDRKQETTPGCTSSSGRYRARLSSSKWGHWTGRSGALERRQGCRRQDDTPSPQPAWALPRPGFPSARNIREPRSGPGSSTSIARAPLQSPSPWNRATSSRICDCLHRAIPRGPGQWAGSG